MTETKGPSRMTTHASNAPRLLFFAGSARAGSHNKRLARLGALIAEANGIAATFADLGDYPMPLYDADLQTTDGIPDTAKKFEALMKVHTGVFIACPEYNASITPLLKNTLDWVSRIRNDGEEPLAVFKTRVFALGSASPGGMGGLRGLTTVRTVLEMGLGALVLPDQFAVPRAMDAFEDNGHFKNKDQGEQFKAVIQKLARAAHVLHA
jgi:chromate reductase, NAD(P)H dehydrogenase (quinone)